MDELKGQAMRDRLRELWADPDWEARQNLECMTPTELFDAWLTYEGIIGYTSSIIEALEDSGFTVEQEDEEL